MKDTQKQKLYNAEVVLHRFDVFFKNTLDLDAYVNRIVSSEWWHERKGPPKVKAIVSRRDSRRADARKNGYYGGTSHGCPIIKLPGSWAVCQSVILHEMAHLITPDAVQDHGPEYARNYLDIVREFKGDLTARKLEESLDAYNACIAPEIAYRNASKVV